jgi:lipopolysaccharide transport system permease protein
MHILAVILLSRAGDDADFGCSHLSVLRTFSHLNPARLGIHLGIEQQQINKAGYRVQPGEDSFALYIRKIWISRAMCVTLANRDIRIKYSRLVLGISWTFIQPLAYLLAFVLIFDGLLNIDVGYPYILFVYPGIIAWTLFNYIFSQSGTSLLQAQDIVKRLQILKVYLPLSKALTGLFDFALAFFLLIPLVIFYRQGLDWTIIFLPIAILGIVFLALGLGMILASFSVFHRDLQYLSPFLVGLSIWITPVFYPVSIVPASFEKFLYLNPMTGCLELLRWSITPGFHELNPLAFADLGACIMLFFIALYLFKSVEYKASDAL